MIIRSLLACLFISSITLLAGCGGTKCLIEDCKSTDMSSQVIEIELGEKKEILNYKRGMMWGGYAPGLFSEDTNIVSIEYDETRKGHKAFIVAKSSGTSKVHLVNRLGAGAVNQDSTERAYWLDNQEGSKFYFRVTVE